MNKCKKCGKEIQSSEKVCPECGTKLKEPFYKKWWVWAIACLVIIVLVVPGENESEPVSTTGTQNVSQAETSAPSQTLQTSEPPQETEDNIPTEYKSALRKAKSYSDNLYMSKAGIYEQLTSEYGEKFSEEAAQYAIDNLETDYKRNALKKAQSYQNSMDMSPAAIHDQLTSEYGEGFTEEEADYASENLE